MRPLAPLLASCLALLAASPEARANGRFPAAGQLVVSPDDPQIVALRATFGLLLSRDGGASFGWVCEQALGYMGEEDPPIAVLGGGAIAVLPYDRLSLSRDVGCSFDDGGISASGETMIDVALCRSQPREAVVLGWYYASKRSHTLVHTTHDGGLTFEPPRELDDGEVIPTTIDLAPGSPSHIYIAGARTGPSGPVGAVLRSTDAGQSFTRVDVPLQGEGSLYLSAIDPVDPMVIYVRTLGQSGDRLLRSSDGGDTFVELARSSGKWLGFALSPDGSKVAVGGPDDGVLSGPSAGPLGAVSGEGVSCLTWADAGLYACGASGASFAVGRSSDDGASFEPLLPRLADIDGLRADCPAGGVYEQLCAPAWPLTAQLLGKGGSSASAGAGGEPGSVGGAGEGGGGAGGGGLSPGGGAAGDSGGNISAGNTSAGAPSQAAGAGGGGAEAPVGAARSGEGDSLCAASRPGRGGGTAIAAIVAAAVSAALRRRAPRTAPASPPRASR